MRRFFSQKIDLKKNRAELGPGESHHLIKVLRMQPGEKIEIFDGKGNLWLAEIEKIEEGKVLLKLLDKIEQRGIEFNYEIHAFISIPKGQRLDLLIEKLVELGVTHIHPVIFERTIRRPTGIKERWNSIILSASKQSKRLRLAEISEPRRLKDILPQLKNLKGNKILAHPEAREFIFDSQWEPGNFYYVIGPEGGLTYEEIELFKSLGFKLYNLGPYILRVETAAIFTQVFILSKILKFN